MADEATNVNLQNVSLLKSSHGHSHAPGETCGGSKAKEKMPTIFDVVKSGYICHFLSFKFN